MGQVKYLPHLVFVMCLDKPSYLCIMLVMRRKAGELIPIERTIVETAKMLKERGQVEFHGFQIAKEMADTKGAKRLTGYGTLYLALHRLEEMGYLSSRWEAQEETGNDNRPRRRLYHLAD